MASRASKRRARLGELRAALHQGRTADQQHNQQLEEARAHQAAETGADCLAKMAPQQEHP